MPISEFGPQENEPDEPEVESTKATFVIATSDIELLKMLTSQRGSIGVNTVLRQAIHTEAFIQGLQDVGAKFFVQMPDSDEPKQIIFDQTVIE